MSVHRPWARPSLAAVAALSFLILGASPASAQDAPAPETKDQGKDAANKKDAKKDSDWWDASRASKVDSFGTFGDTIAIETPEFRKIGPKLSLSYTSTGGNGWTGVGWTLEAGGRIERASPGKGAPRYDGSDIYLLDGEELIPCATGSTSPSCTTGGTHSTKKESYVRIALSGSGASSQWTVTDKDGSKSIYRPVFTLAGGQIFRYGLQQEIDTKNNVVTYNWGSNLLGGVGEHLDSIAYDGTTIKLHYEARTDVESGATGAGALERIAGRIKTVDISVGSSRLRAYQLKYTNSGATGRSLLASVQVFGRDATLDGSGTVTGGTSLPAIAAGYRATTNPSFAAGASDSGMGNGNDRRFISLDINGDGKSDMLEVYKECFIICAHKAGAWISNGTGFDRAGTVAIPSYDETAQFLALDINGDGKDDFITLTKNGTKWKRSVFVSSGTTFTAGPSDSSMVYKVVGDEKKVVSHFLPTDINGDGKDDLIEIYPSACFLCATVYNRVAWISNGTGFTQASTAGGMTYNIDSEFYAGDFDGDGKGDFVEFQPGMFGALARRVWLSNGTSFTLGSSDTSTHTSGNKYLVMDVNGDGKTDVVEFLAMIVSTRRVWLSTGSSFTLGSSVTNGWAMGDSTRLIAGDFNGDGRSDFAAFYPFGFSVTRSVYLSKGDDFVSGSVDYLGNAGEHKYLAGDINGDGLTDMVETWSAFMATGRKTWLIGGAYPDLLASLGTIKGGTTTIDYTPSSAWSNVGGAPIVQTATSVTVADGRGGSSKTTYTYADARYDAPNRRFLGFASQKETQPCITGESACPYVTTTFRQDNGAVGKPTRIDQRDGSGRLLRSNLFEYAVSTTLPWTALETGRWEHAFIGTGAACPGAECKRKYVARTFNAYGDVAQEFDYGNYDTTGDEVTIANVYVPNTSAYIVQLAADVKTFQGIGTGGALLNETVEYYDGATSWNVPPTAGLPTKMARWLSSPSAFIETRSEYDAWGNVTATVNALGARATSTFDPTYHRFSISATNPLGQSTTTSWDFVCGEPLVESDLNGQETSFTYDPLCRLAQKTAPGGKFERHSWVNLGIPASQYEQVEHPAADGTSAPRWTRRYFDGQDRTWRDAKKGPNTTTGDIYIDTTYNARGKEASKTAPYYFAGTPAVYTRTFGYDALDRPTRTTFPDGAQQTTTYGLWSRTTIDELGRSKTDRVNSHDKRVAHDEVIGGVTKTTTFVLDARDHVRQSVDPAGNTITYTTDSLGRKTSMVDPDSGTWSYEYDGEGRRTAQTDPKSQRTTFGYDALGRKISKTSSAGTSSAVTVTWTFDEVRAGFYNVGKVTTTTDAAGTETFDHDVAGRIVKNVRVIGGSTYTFQHGFDDGGRRLWTVYPDGDTQGTVVAPLRYDSAGRLVTIPGYVRAVTYDAADQVTQITNDNGTVTSRPRSASRGWITGIATTAGATTLQALAYTRNAKGLITEIGSPFANEGWTYEYDELDRLTMATNGSDWQHSQTIAYDAIGNITSNSRVGAYVYGARPHAVTSAGGSVYTYDAGGLMTSGGGRTLTWDGDNRLASATATTGGSTMTYTYDADGDRIQQFDGNTTRRYFGDDYEVDGLGKVTKYFAVGDALVARKEGTTKTWLHTDHLNTVQAETNAAGLEVHRQKYRPYGEIMSTDGELAYEPRGYIGQRHDESGLLFLHARYYDPMLARFISPDSIISSDDTIGLNRFAYSDNDPINKSDPSGMCVFGLKCPEIVKEIAKTTVVVVGSVAATAVCGPACGIAAGMALNVAVNALDGQTSMKEIALNAVMGASPVKGLRVPGVTKIADEVADLSKIPRPTYIPRGADGKPLPLPKGPNGELAPSSPYPHTQIGYREGRRDSYVQTREFGYDGQPIKQVEYTNHGRPAEHTDPHVHDYIPNESGGTPKHGPARPPRRGELGDR